MRLCFVILMFSQAHAQFTDQITWTDPVTETIFYLDDEPYSGKYYYLPPLEILPYIGGKHEYYDRTDHNPWFGGDYHKYYFRLHQSYDVALLERATAHFGPGSQFFEISLNYFEFETPHMPNRPFDSVEVTPDKGEGPFFPREFDVIFIVSSRQKERFENFLSSRFGLSLIFDLNIRGSRLLYEGYIYAKRNLYEALREKTLALGRPPSHDEAEQIFQSLKEEGYWKIKRHFHDEESEQAQQADQDFSRAIQGLILAYFDIDTEGHYIQRPENQARQLLPIERTEHIDHVYPRVKFRFILKLPEGIGAEIIEKNDGAKNE